MENNENAANDLNELNSILFDTLRGVKDGDVDEKKAQTIVNVGNSIINNAKTQLSAYKITKGKTGVGSFGKMSAPDPGLIESGDTYEQKQEYALSRGFNSVAAAIGKLGKGDFEKGFKRWINSK